MLQLRESVFFQRTKATSWIRVFPTCFNFLDRFFFFQCAFACSRYYVLVVGFVAPFLSITFSFTSISIYDWFCFLWCGLYAQCLQLFFLKTCFLFPFYYVLLKHSAFRRWPVFWAPTTSSFARSNGAVLAKSVAPPPFWGPPRCKSGRVNFLKFSPGWWFFLSYFSATNKKITRQKQLIICYWQLPP